MVRMIIIEMYLESILLNSQPLRPMCYVLQSFLIQQIALHAAHVYYHLHLKDKTQSGLCVGSSQLIS